MSYNVPVSIYLLLLSNAALLAAAIVAILRFQALIRTSQQYWSRPAGSPSQQQQIESHAESEQTGFRTNNELEQRVTSLQASVNRLSEKDVVQPVPVTRDLPIENAARMARHGASVADITRSCGLNIGEAQLMKKLHSRSLSKALTPATENRV